MLPLSPRLIYDKESMLRRRYSEGFALPTIVITSVVMFAILVAAVGTVSSTSDAINTQYYESLAADAAESGANHATSCLDDNNQTSTWGTNQLHPNTTCAGGAACTGTDNCYVVKADTYTSTYTVGQVTNTGTGAQTATVTGTVTLVRKSTGTSWRTFTKTLNIRTGAQVSANQVVFGYVSGGGSFFATVGGDGVMRATGYNSQGQLGNGSYAATLVPKKFLAPTTVPIVSGYTSFLSQGTSMFSVDANGDAFGAGENDLGQIGAGSAASFISTPARVALPAGKKVRFITVRGSATYFITTDNNVYAAGDCAGGALGTGYTISGCVSQSTPVRVALPAPNAGDPNTIPTNDLITDRTTTYIRMAGGRVYGWGSNDRGQLEDVSFADTSTPTKISVYGDTGQPRATKIVYDGETLYVLDSSGTLKSVGTNSNGQMGTDVMSFRVNTTGVCMDQANADGVTIRVWTCNETPSQKFSVRSDGTVYNANRNVCLTTPDSASLKVAPCNGSSSQKFNWDPDVRAKFGRLRHAPTGKCVDSLNYDTSGGTLALSTCDTSANQTLYSVNASMQAFNSSVFAGSVVDVTTDQWAVAVRTSNGEVWGAGVNTSGQLGNGTQREFQAVPVKFAMPVTAKYIYTTNNGSTDLFSYQNLFAIGTNGRVYGAGSNTYGQLGNGSTAAAVKTPVAMNVIDGTTVSATSVQVGLGTAVVFTSNGSVYTVGNNTYGQLGDGTTTNRSTPIRAKYLNDLKTITY